MPTVRKRLAISAALSAFVVATASVPAHAEDDLEPTPTIRRGTPAVIVSFDSPQADPAQSAIEAVGAVGAVDVIPVTDEVVAVVLRDPAEANDAAAHAARQPEVEAAEPSIGLAAATNDTYWGTLWGLNGAYGVGADSAWEQGFTGSGLVAAVIDTGSAPHPELTWLPGYDFVSDAGDPDGGGWDPDPTDACGGSWHGVHVAGTIAARADNGVGIAGVAPDAGLLPVRMLGCEVGEDWDLVAAIYWAAGLRVHGVPDNAHPADVINMSLSGEGDCPVSVQNAIDAAVRAGSVVVVSAGNQSSPVARAFPANCDGVVSVAAHASGGAMAGFSNYGTAELPVTISGPGVGIYSTLGGPGYGSKSGTSMAAPHVTGAAILTRQANPTLSPAQVMDVLKATARELSCDRACGAGGVDADAAVTEARARVVAPTPTPTPSPTEPTPTPSVTPTPSPSPTPTPTPTPMPTPAPTPTRSPTPAPKTNLPAKRPITKGTVTIKATAKTGKKLKVGKKVKATVAGFAPSSVTLNYRWLRNGKAIPKATRSTYRLVKADKGKRLSVKVTATKPGYVKVSVTSAKTRKIVR